MSGFRAIVVGPALATIRERNGQRSHYRSSHNKSPVAILCSAGADRIARMRYIRQSTQPALSSEGELSAGGRTTTETMVQFPSRKSEMLCWANERSSNTAVVPSPSGDWVLIPTQIDAG